MSAVPLQSWGNHPPIPQVARACHWRAELPVELAALQAECGSTLAYGAGRSYGDSCLAASGHVLHMAALDRFLAADWSAGRLTAEAGVTLADILAVAIPRGWFLPVTPGTRFVTLGGAIANDVHGKNHHSAGSFGASITRLRLLRTDGGAQELAPGDALFHATIGGLGLTGIIEWVEFRAVRIPSTNLDAQDAEFTHVRDYFDLAARDMVDVCEAKGWARIKLVSRGAAQMEASRVFWGVPRFDLMQVHNLLSWEEHLPRLQEMKAAGRLRYVGISTSEGRRHAELERIMRTQKIDFVQLTHNLLDREAEQRLLPLAQERGIAVLVNRPFRQGDLLDQLARHPLPGWAGEIGCSNWAQVALKFVVSHPGVTCAIPATSQVAHLRHNMGAALGPMPDAALRERMARDVAAL